MASLCPRTASSSGTLKFAPTEASDGPVLPHLSYRVGQCSIIVERGSRLIVEVFYDVASVQTHGCAGSIVRGGWRIEGQSVWHSTEPDVAVPP